MAEQEGVPPQQHQEQIEGAQQPRKRPAPGQYCSYRECGRELGRFLLHRQYCKVSICRDVSFVFCYSSRTVNSVRQLFPRAVRSGCLFFCFDPLHHQNRFLFSCFEQPPRTSRTTNAILRGEQPGKFSCRSRCGDCAKRVKVYCSKEHQTVSRNVDRVSLLLLRSTAFL